MPTSSSYDLQQEVAPIQTSWGKMQPNIDKKNHEGCNQTRKRHKLHKKHV